MSGPREQSADTSLDEILSSIRRIISDDDRAGAGAAPAPGVAREAAPAMIDGENGIAAPAVVTGTPARTFARTSDVQPQGEVPRPRETLAPFDRSAGTAEAPVVVASPVDRIATIADNVLPVSATRIPAPDADAARASLNTPIVLPTEAPDAGPLVSDLAPDDIVELGAPEGAQVDVTPPTANGVSTANGTSGHAEPLVAYPEIAVNGTAANGARSVSLALLGTETPADGLANNREPILNGHASTPDPSAANQPVRSPAVEAPCVVPPISIIADVLAASPEVASPDVAEVAACEVGTDVVEPVSVAAVAADDACAQCEPDTEQVAPPETAADTQSPVAPADTPVDDSDAVMHAVLEQKVSSLLRPMLKEWLDENMPRLIEEALREPSPSQAVKPNGSAT